MSDKLGDPAGFALRINGTCLDSEVDCGFTVLPFRACCPGGSYCPSQYNVNCCPSAANCTQLLTEKPRCANETWDLYDNNGYFCCSPGTIGYAAPSNSDGCALPGFEFSKSHTLLRVISSGKVSVPTSTSSRASSTSLTPSTPSTLASTTSTISSSSQTPTQTPDIPSSSGSGTNTGAIVGGVVGGVAGVASIAILIWWLLSRRMRRQPASPETQVVPVENYETKTRVARELDGCTPLQELESPADHPPHELPGESVVSR